MRAGGCCRAQCGLMKAGGAWCGLVGLDGARCLRVGAGGPQPSTLLGGDGGHLHNPELACCRAGRPQHGPFRAGLTLYTSLYAAYSYFSVCVCAAGGKHCVKQLRWPGDGEGKPSEMVMGGTAIHLYWCAAAEGNPTWPVQGRAAAHSFIHVPRRHQLLFLFPLPPTIPTWTRGPPPACHMRMTFLWLLSMSGMLHWCPHCEDGKEPPGAPAGQPSYGPRSQ